MANPHYGMVSFQQELIRGRLVLGAVEGFQDLYSYMDEPTPGEPRLTYARLTPDRRYVTAYLSCIMNGYVEGIPCVSIGYAVPEELRNNGLAKAILRDVIKDQLFHARLGGHESVYFEAVVDVTNLASQRVATTVLKSTPENMLDTASGRPAFRYTAHVNINNDPKN